MIRPFPMALLSVLTLVTACGDDSTGPGGEPTPTPVARVEIREAPAELTVGRTVQLGAVAFASSGSVLAGRTITWRSSATAVVTVDNSGKLTAVAEGTAEITATSEGKVATTTVRVMPSVRTVASVEIQQGAAADLFIGGSSAFTAVVRDAQGAIIDGRPVTWTSTDTDVLSVTSAGVASGGAPGEALLIAFAEQAADTIVITVETNVRRVDVSPQEATLFIGEQEQLTAQAFGRDGQPVAATISWSSSDASVLEVSAAGRVTARRPGVVTVSATAEGVRGFTVVGVVGVTNFTAVTANGALLPATLFTSTQPNGAGGTRVRRYDVQQSSFRLTGDGRYTQTSSFLFFSDGEPMGIGTLSTSGDVLRDRQTGEFFFTPDDPNTPAFTGLRTLMGELQVTQRYLAGATESVLVYRVQ